MMSLLAIAMGGAVGALSRYWVASALYGWLGRGFPIGTLVINVSGSFLMGLLAELFINRFPVSVEFRSAILVGFLGAYTTFSTFALESFMLIEEASYWKAGFNMLLSVLLCVASVWFGVLLGRGVLSEASLALFIHNGTVPKLLGAVIVCVATGLFWEIIAKYVAWAAYHREFVLLLLMGVGASASALLFLPELGDSGRGVAALLLFFAINALVGAGSVGLGVMLGRLW
ncbi:MAG: fluoride efflux transporter CrcB [Methylococcaceae bacterium]|jgi:CrcB protein